ncbi:MAG TPA: DoxX family protein [Vicinamibacterales bacterium]
MLFFALLLVLTLLFGAASALGVPGLPPGRDRMRLALSTALLFIGVDHLVTPERYLPMMPPMLPAPRALVLFTGLCEIAGAIGLLIPRTRRLAGIMLAVYFVSVFPANIYVAMSGGSVAGMPESAWYYWVRLLFQPVAIWWAWYVGAAPGKRRLNQP